MDYKGIAQEILKWSNEVIEKPLKTFGDLPACPYARTAWAKNHVLMHVVFDLDPVIEIKAASSLTDPNVHVIAWLDYSQMTAQEFNNWIEDQNKNHFGVWLMGFHPDSEENTMMPEFDGIVEDDYGLILVQSLEYLVKASNDLRKTRYYNDFSPEDMAYINNRKDIYDAWNEKIGSQKTSFSNEEKEKKVI